MINIPSEWKKIDESNYDKIGIVNNKFVNENVNSLLYVNSNVSTISTFVIELSIPEDVL